VSIQVFLNLLNEKQKTLFLKLAVKAAEANDTVSGEEAAMLDEFAKEMQIDPVHESEEPTDELLCKIVNISSKKALRIVTFEILGILYSDGKYDDAERMFVKKMSDTFGISSETVEDMERAINEYASVYSRITKIVFN